MQRGLGLLVDEIDHGMVLLSDDAQEVHVNHLARPCRRPRCLLKLVGTPQPAMVAVVPLGPPGHGRPPWLVSSAQPPDLPDAS